ncbi:MAG: DUF4325 domain-containing protein [Patescibacteria group bacterium]
MDINKLIINGAQKEGTITVAKIVNTTGFSRAYIHRFFQKLIDNGKLTRIGKANRAVYTLSNASHIRKAKKKNLSFVRTFVNKGLGEDAVFELIQKETGILEGVSVNVHHIINYAFTEMLNNAIEHSHSVRVKISVARDKNIIRFDVIDWGVGIFENLIHHRHLKSSEEAIQDLLKGKQTTAPETHTGEGIFFTRRIADTFVIRSSTKKLFFNNIINDFTLISTKPVVGTRIIFTIAIKTKKILNDVFRVYTNESFEFGVTEVVVRLYQKGGAREFISRSQARRIFSGLEKFKKIILDFTNVVSIGQGFADEVFRIWQGQHKDIVIETKNANSDVIFMIKRAPVMRGAK